MEHFRNWAPVRPTTALQGRVCRLAVIPTRFLQHAKQYAETPTQDTSRTLTGSVRRQTQSAASPTEPDRLLTRAQIEDELTAVQTKEGVV